MKLALVPRFIRQYGALSEPERKRCDAMLEQLPAAFGQPHRHAGLGIRSLRRGLYECRVSQAVRVGFTRHNDILLLHTVGNHEVIRAWLRNP